MLQLLLFALFCIFAGIIAFGTFAVLYHFQRFRLNENAHRGRVLLFLAVSAFFVWLEISFAAAISRQDVLNLITHNQFIR